MKKALFLVLISVLVLVLVVGCVPAEKRCAKTEDCAPASCCHASEAVNKEYAPDCSGMLCTAICEPGTTDCGQGEIECVKGRCEVALKE